MILLILDKKGFEESKQLFDNENLFIWINATVLSEKELQHYRKDGLEITNFSYFIPSPDSDEAKEAIKTIEEHHPDEVIWLQT